MSGNNSTLDAGMSGNDSTFAGATLPEAMADMADIASRLATLETNSNIFFMMINAILVYLMQAGFSLLECGSVRSKNASSVLLKNYIDTMFCGIAYWIFGYALAFGGNPNAFCGTRFWAGETMDSGDYMKWFYQFSFASTTATIVSGAIAERCRLEAYMVYSFVVSAFIYPIQSHWGWHPAGWLFKGDGEVGFQDFAGSGVVHLCGGAISIVAAAVIGPRLGRFKAKERAEPVTHHSAALISLGCFILFVGFFSFNGSSQQAISGVVDGLVASNAVRNTAISGSFATATGLLVAKTVSHIRTRGHGRWSLFTTVNCGLSGLVAICGVCDRAPDWGAACIGIIAGLSYFFWSWLMVRLRIDDAVDAVAVHFGGGFWGLIAQPIFKKNDGLLFKVATDEAYTAWMGLAWNVAGIAAIAAWSMACSFLLFGGLKVLRRLRIPEEIEREGMDFEEMEEECYPPTAYSGFMALGHSYAHVSVVPHPSKDADFV